MEMMMPEQNPKLRPHPRSKQEIKRSSSTERLLEESARVRSRLKAYRSSLSDDGVDEKKRPSYHHIRSGRRKSSEGNTLVAMEVTKPFNPIDLNDFHSEEPKGKDVPDKHQQPSDETLHAMKLVVRTVLEHPTQKVDRLACYKAIQEYAMTKCQLHNLTVQLNLAKRRLADQEERDAAAPAVDVRTISGAATSITTATISHSNLTVGQISQLTCLMDELEVIHEREQEEFQEMLAGKNLLLNEHERELRAKTGQVEGLGKQVEQLNKQNAAYQQEIQAVRAILEERNKATSVKEQVVAEESNKVPVVEATAVEGNEMAIAVAVAAVAGATLQAIPRGADKETKSAKSADDDPLVEANIDPTVIELRTEVEKIRMQLRIAELKVKENAIAEQAVKDEMKEALKQSEEKAKVIKQQLEETVQKLEDAYGKIELLEAFVIEDAKDEELFSGNHNSASAFMDSLASLEFNDNSSSKLAVALEEARKETRLIKAEASDLKKGLVVAQALVSEMERDRHFHKAAMAELSSIPDVRGETETQKCLYDKSLQCAELRAAQEVHKQELWVTQEQVKNLERECSVTRKLVAELSQKSVGDPNSVASVDEIVGRLRREQDESLKTAAQLSSELSEIRAKSTSQQESGAINNANSGGSAAAAAPPKRPPQSNKHPRAASLGKMPYFKSANNGLLGNKSDHNYSVKRGSRARSLLSMGSTGISTSIMSDDDPNAIIRRLSQKIADLEGQNSAYEMTVSAMKRELETTP